MIKRLWQWLTGRSQPSPTPAPPTPPAADTPAEPATAPPEDDPLAALLPFQIRPLTQADLPALLPVFQQAVDSTANHYDPHQRQAWRNTMDTATLKQQLGQGEVVVAQWDEELVGFAQRNRDQLEMVFVHPQTARVGIATLMIQHLEDSARAAGVGRLHTRASLAAHDFFTFMGFTADSEERVERQGIRLPHLHMHKTLDPAASSDA